MKHNEDTFGQKNHPLQKDGLKNMEADLSSPKKLDDLPPSEDIVFWAHAEVHTNIIAHDWMCDKEHFFIRISGREAYCNGCGWGFELDPGDKIIDGHLYDRKGKLVI